MSLTHTRLRAAVRVMRYYNSVPLTGTGIAPVRAGQTTSLLVVMILLYKFIKKHLQIPTGRPLKSIKQKFFHKGRNKRNRRSGKPAEKALLYHFISRNGMRSVLCCSSSTRSNPSNGNPQGTLMQGFGAFPALKKRLPLMPWLSAPNSSRQKQKPDPRR